MRTVSVGLYRHYKGNTYRVIGIAKHSETLEDLVVYVPQYENAIAALWVRPLSMFTETVTVNGKTVARFEKIDVEKSI